MQLVKRGYEGISKKPYGLLASTNMIECAIHLGLVQDKIDALVEIAETDAAQLSADWLKSRIYLQKSRLLRDRHNFDSATEAAMRSLWHSSRAAEWDLLYARHCYRQAVARSMLDMGEIGEACLRYEEILTSSGGSHWGRVCGHIGLSRVAIAFSRPAEAVSHGALAVAEAHYMHPLAVTYAVEASYDAYSYAGEQEKATRAVRDLLFYTARCDSVRRRYKALARAANSPMAPEGAIGELASLAERLVSSCGFADVGGGYDKIAVCSADG